MLNFVNPKSVSVPSKEERDEDYSLNLVLTRLRKFHRQYKKDGKGYPNLLVNRTNGLNLAIKIANETAQFVPIDESKSILEQIENTIQDLPLYKRQIFEFYSWVSQNTAKKKAERTPLPDIDWNVETGLQEAS